MISSSEINILSLPVENTEFIDFTGKERNNGVLTKSEKIISGSIINAYHKGTLIGSIAYEVYSDFCERVTSRLNLSGPFFVKKSERKILMHTVYVKEEYRGNGIMLMMLNVISSLKLPVYASFQNISLKQYFIDNFLAW